MVVKMAFLGKYWNEELLERPAEFLGSPCGDVHISRSIVLLLARNFASVAAKASIQVNNQQVVSHA
jgi:hypothetical protein